jgi:hypothetical protein
MSTAATDSSSDAKDRAQAAVHELADRVHLTTEQDGALRSVMLDSASDFATKLLRAYYPSQYTEYSML